MGFLAGSQSIPLRERALLVKYLFIPNEYEV